MNKDLEKLLAEADDLAALATGSVSTGLAERCFVTIRRFAREVRNQEAILGDQAIDLHESAGMETGLRRGRRQGLALVPVAEVGRLLSPWHMARAVLRAKDLHAAFKIETALDLLNLDTEANDLSMWRFVGATPASGPDSFEGIMGDFGTINAGHLIRVLQDAVEQYIEDGVIGPKEYRFGKGQ